MCAPLGVALLLLTQVGVAPAFPHPSLACLQDARQSVGIEQYAFKQTEQERNFAQVNKGEL